MLSSSLSRRVIIINTFRNSYTPKVKKRDFKKITLNNVNFIYSKENKIFKNLNLEIHKGDKIGIIGKTGSGKSTFVNILCGLLDVTKGEIYFDENNKEKDYKSIQNLIGYVPQTVSIFDESVQFNVCLSDDLTDEKFQKFQKVLEIVDMDTLVDSLPNNHNELVGENGSRFSGGQNQRLGIARAIYKNPKILILDEATSALDLETEKKIIQNILNYLPELTLISISHRPASLNFCDKIFQTVDQDLIEIKK